MTQEPKIVHLSKVARTDDFEFRFAEIWDDAPSLPIVHIRGPKLIDIALRMDMFKRAFIDFVADDKINGAIRSKAFDVWENIMLETKTASPTTIASV